MNPEDSCSACSKVGRQCGPKLLAREQRKRPAADLHKRELWDPEEPLIPKIMERTGGRMSIDEVVHKLRQEFQMIGEPDPWSRSSAASVEHEDPYGYRYDLASFINTQTPLPYTPQIPSTIVARHHVPSRPPLLRLSLHGTITTGLFLCPHRRASPSLIPTLVTVQFNLFGT